MVSAWSISLFACIQELVGGRVKDVEEQLRSVFQKHIGAHDVPKSTEIKEGVTWNASKSVFQACVKIGDQSLVTEFKTSDDAKHWVDILKALESKGLLKAHFATMRQAEANRKATQEAYEKIIAADKAFQPEDSKSFAKNPQEGKDIWANFFGQSQKKAEPSLPCSSIRFPKNSMDKLRELGYERELRGEILGWEHRTLGWRAVRVLTHTGIDNAQEHLDKIAADCKLTHLGFVRCVHTKEKPKLSDQDKTQLEALAKNNTVLAIVASYPEKIGAVGCWQLSHKGTSAQIKEVELGFILRRVENEQFLVHDLVPQATFASKFESLVRGVFNKHLDKKEKEASAHLVSFQRLPVLGDGLCFYHCFLRCSLWKDYKNVSRGRNGAPTSKERLADEISMAKALRSELLALCGGTDKPEAKEMAEGNEVGLELAHYICCLSQSTFRITIADEAWRFIFNWCSWEI